MTAFGDRDWSPTSPVASIVPGPPTHGACHFIGIDVRDMGVWIEDSFLITNYGPECLSESVPWTVEGIDALLK